MEFVWTAVLSAIAMTARDVSTTITILNTKHAVCVNTLLQKWSVPSVPTTPFSPIHGCVHFALIALIRPYVPLVLDSISAMFQSASLAAVPIHPQPAYCARAINSLALNA